MSKCKIIWTPEQYKKRVEYNAKYNKQNTVTVLVRLNKKTDADLIDLMDQLKDKGAPKSGYFKDAARCYMKCNPITKK